MPRVSVIIPTYNRAGILPSAIESSLGQTLAGVEVIVVDDGSEDDTRAVLEAYRGRVQIVVHPQNCGISAARNSGLRLAHGELIAFLDSDDVWRSDKLERQAAFLDRHPEVGLVACQAGWIGLDDAAMSGGPPRSPWRGSVGFADVLEGRLGLTSSVVVRREVLERTGGFDESLATSEDYDLWLRATFCTTLFQLSDELMSYRRHPENISRYSRRAVAGEVELCRKWTRAALDREESRLLRRRYANALYRLAVIEARAGSRRSAAGFLAALRRDPLVGWRYFDRPRRVSTGFLQVLKPWVGAAAAGAGLVPLLWRARDQAALEVPRAAMETSRARPR